MSVSVGGCGMNQASGIKQGEILLQLEDIHMYFGKVAALIGVNLKVKKGRFIPSSDQTEPEKR